MKKFSTLMVSFPIGYFVLATSWWYFKGMPEKIYDITSYLGFYYMFASVSIYIDIKIDQRKQKKAQIECKSEGNHN